MLWEILYKNDGTYCITCKKKTANENSSLREKIH